MSEDTIKPKLCWLYNPSPYSNFKDHYCYTAEAIESSNGDEDAPGWEDKDEDLSVSENPDDYIVSDTPLDDILELETITIKLPKSTVNQLDKLSKLTGMNKASLIQSILVIKLDEALDEYHYPSE